MSLDFLSKFFDTQKFYISMNEIDFEGQRKSEIYYKVILTVCCVISIIVSYITQKLQDGVFIMIGGLILSILICVPAWPMYKRHQFKWLKHVDDEKKKN